MRARATAYSRRSKGAPVNPLKKQRAFCQKPSCNYALNRQLNFRWHSVKKRWQRQLRHGSTVSAVATEERARRYKRRARLQRRVHSLSEWRLQWESETTVGRVSQCLCEETSASPTTLSATSPHPDVYALFLFIAYTTTAAVLLLRRASVFVGVSCAVRVSLNGGEKKELWEKKVIHCKAFSLPRLGCHSIPITSGK